MEKIFKWIAGVIVAVAIFGIGIGIGRSTAPTSLSGERAGLQEFKDGITRGDVTDTWAVKKMDAGSNSALIWYNNTGKDVVADYGEADVLTGQTASSTSNISLFATTSSTVASTFDFLAYSAVSIAKQSLISAVIIATTTTATTTSSTYAISAQKGNGSILIPAGSYVFGYLQQNTTLASVGCSGSGLCETATSTNRGFNPVFKLHITFPK